MTLTKKSREFLGTAKLVQDQHGVVIMSRLKGLPPLLLQSHSTLSYHTHKLEELGFLTRLGNHWKLTEAGLAELGGYSTPKPVKILCDPLRLAEKMTTTFRHKVYEASPVDNILPQNQAALESLVDDAIALVKTFIEQRCVKE